MQGLANDAPADELFALINAGWTTQVIRTACVLELPDRIAAGMGDVAALAAAAGCAPRALARMLRAMTSIGQCEANVEQHYCEIGVEVTYRITRRDHDRTDLLGPDPPLPARNATAALPVYSE